MFSHDHLFRFHHHVPGGGNARAPWHLRAQKVMAPLSPVSELWSCEAATVYEVVGAFSTVVVSSSCGRGEGIAKNTANVALAKQDGLRMKLLFAGFASEYLLCRIFLCAMCRCAFLLLGERNS